MRTGRWLRVRIVAAILLTVSGSVHAQSRLQRRQSGDSTQLAERLGVRTLRKGSSARSARQQALQALPLNRLPERSRARANSVLRSVSQFRQLPRLSARIEPDVYRYFMSHPDVAVSLWRVMQISEFQLWQTGPSGFRADAGDGSRGTADILYRSDRECLVICDGVYKNPLIKKSIDARALIHLQFDFSRPTPGVAPYVTHQISAFISFPSTTVKTVAKVISPITNMIMDRNALEVTVFLKVMSDSMYQRPEWVQGLASRMDGVIPDRRRELAALAGRIHTAAREKNLQTYLLRPPPGTATDARNALLSVTGDNMPGALLKVSGEAPATPAGKN